MTHTRTAARAEGAMLLPFLLKGVAGQPALNQADGIHPNVKGERIVASTMWGGFAPVLRSIMAAAGPSARGGA